MAKGGQGTSFEAGDLRRRIQLLQPVDTPNGSGGSTRTYTVVSGCTSVPARITYPPPSKKGDEVFTQGQVRSTVFTTITIRFRPSLNVNAAMRVGYGTRIFDIRTVLPVDEYRQEITLQVEEVQAVGSQHV